MPESFRVNLLTKFESLYCVPKWDCLNLTLTGVLILLHGLVIELELLMDPPREDTGRCPEYISTSYTYINTLNNIITIVYDSLPHVMLKFKFFIKNFNPVYFPA